MKGQFCCVSEGVLHFLSVIGAFHTHPRSSSQYFTLFTLLSILKATFWCLYFSVLDINGYEFLTSKTYCSRPEQLLSLG